MNEYKNLVNAYLKLKDGVQTLNEIDEKLILTSEDELNRCFNREHLRAIDIINDNLDKLKRINLDDGLSDYYLNSVYQD